MTPSTLDDLKFAWQQLSEKLDRQSALTLHQLRENKRGRFRSGLRPLLIGQVMQLIAGICIALPAAQFWIEHRAQFHLFICGVTLHAYAILMIIFAARDLFLIRSIDYAAPVVVIEKQLARLRSWHLTAALWFGVSGCFIWVPFLLVVFYSLGADVWRHDPQVVMWLLFSGSICLLTFASLVLLARGQNRFASSLRRTAIGRAVTRAQNALDELARFENE